ncbi:MAG: hypothetical protein L0Y72_02090 [Gemmataceae bacterium]|nr:hypothetical protein [Gemmataceae bacterium]MCI0737806.1 hypothetical protein [Gemmataceae bacterium]
MTTELRIHAALRSSNPTSALRALVQKLDHEGMAKKDVHTLVERFLVQYRTSPDFREGDEDALLDVLDALSGWCHPTAKLLPDKSER